MVRSHVQVGPGFPASGLASCRSGIVLGRPRSSPRSRSSGSYINSGALDIFFTSISRSNASLICAAPTGAAVYSSLDHGDSRHGVRVAAVRRADAARVRRTHPLHEGDARAARRGQQRPAAAAVRRGAASMLDGCSRLATAFRERSSSPASRWPRSTFIRTWALSCARRCAAATGRWRSEPSG